MKCPRRSRTGESSWHPQFTADGDSVHVVSRTGGQVVVHDAHNVAEVARIEAKTPSSVFNIGARIPELGLSAAARQRAARRAKAPIIQAGVQTSTG